MDVTEALLHFAQNAEETGKGAIFDGADLSPERLVRLSEGGSGSLNLRGRDLAGASLRSANLSGADLSNADLSQIMGSGLNLHGARLEGAQLVEADLVGADLGEASAGEADLSGALLEDGKLQCAKLRFADFSKAILDGADFSEADLWGAKFRETAADRVLFRQARLDESSLIQAELAGADFFRATLRRADLSMARLQNANLREAVLDGANLAGANLRGALLPNLSLTTCTLTRVCFAGAWLERTRMHAHQIGGQVGEESLNDLEGAIDSYLVLERNFISLGNSEDASWAYLRRRQVGRRLHGRAARAEMKAKRFGTALRPGALWVADMSAEWLCNYGESLYRVGRSFLTIMIVFALLYWVTGSLSARDGFANAHPRSAINYLLFSLNSMTTVGTSEIALKPKGELGTLLSSLQTVLGTVLLGLFGFVLGARIRS